MPVKTAKYKIHAKSNPVTRLYVPKEVADWLGLSEEGSVAIQMEEVEGKRVAVFWDVKAQVGSLQLHRHAKK